MKTHSPTARVLLGTGIAALLIAGAAAAGHGGHGRGHFDKIDTDGDGKISQAEISSAMDKRMAGLDANNDGFVTFEEMRAHRDRMREEAARKRFARHDANGDGRVAVDEIRAGHMEHFTKMDANGDGVIEKGEMRHGRGMRGGKRMHGRDD